MVVVAKEPVESARIGIRRARSPHPTILIARMMRNGEKFRFHSALKSVVNVVSIRSRTFRESKSFIFLTEEKIRYIIKLACE